MWEQRLVSMDTSQLDQQRQFPWSFVIRRIADWQSVYRIDDYIALFNKDLQ